VSADERAPRMPDAATGRRGHGEKRGYQGNARGGGATLVTVTAP
jgi:hypothetical protein